MTQQQPCKNNPPLAGLKGVAYKIRLVCAGMLVVLTLNTAHATPAGALLDSLYADTVGSGAHKARGLWALGEFFYCDADYMRASAFYGRAFDSSREYRYALQQAAALVAQRSQAEAEAILKDIVKSAAKQYRAEAFYYLGLVQWQRNNHSQALDCFIESLEGPDSVSWHIPALTGAWYNARAMGFTGQAERYLQQIRTAGTPLLEEKLLTAQASTNFAFGKTPPRPTPPPPKVADTAVLVNATPRPSDSTTTAHMVPAAAKEQYTVQVGSFSTRGNAQEVYTKLKKDFSTVSIQSAQIDKNTFYRVHVGNFPNREGAEHFARRHIEPRKMTFKVVTR